MMMPENEFHEAARRRAKHVLGWMFLGIGAMLAWLGLVIALGLTGGLVVIPVVLLFMGPLMIAERKAVQLAVPCPNCQEDLAKYTQLVVGTRCCRICHSRVLEHGRQRPVAVYLRAQRVHQARFLDYWFWAWPAFFALVAVPALFDPSWIRR